MSPDRLRAVSTSVTRWVGSVSSIIVHTIIFITVFLTPFLGLWGWSTMLLVLTTMLSFEAIYLAIFIQMTINYTTDSIEEVGEDIEEIQEDIDEIQEDVGKVQEDVDELQEDVGKVQEDVEEISEDVEEMNEEENLSDTDTLVAIHADIQRLLKDVNKLKSNIKQ